MGSMTAQNGHHCGCTTANQRLQAVEYALRNWNRLIATTNPERLDIGNEP